MTKQEKRIKELEEKVKRLEQRMTTHEVLGHGWPYYVPVPYYPAPYYPAWPYVYPTVTWCDSGSISITNGDGVNYWTNTDPSVPFTLTAGGKN